MRIFIKGGSWKNTEDEILKAAVMKYGKNQWARVASLMPRKSAKQCKVRWYEWLDPSVKKTEWTKEEEERLLHLAKTMPTQWRTIAPLVGRTAAQCLEHYEKLVDQANDQTMDPENDPRRLRAGEIDLQPETKPARPDALDMDEDEKEMLNEARARLANTRGKKAKRKARERQLEEARRLASLQKTRELKTAGIVVPQFERRMRRRGIDLAREIPFERKVEQGPFATDQEDQEAKGRRLVENFRPGLTTEKLEGTRRDKMEREARKTDKKKQEEAQRRNLADYQEKINKMNDPIATRVRKDLIMPEPEVGDAELSQVAKMNIMQRPMTPAMGSRTPMSLAASTPMTTHHRPTTPAIGNTPRTGPGSRTPAPGGRLLLGDRKAIELRGSLENGLSALPEPESEYEIGVSLTEQQRELLERGLGEEAMRAKLAEDMSNIDKREREEKARREKEAFELLTKPVQRDLPRPAAVPPQLLQTVNRGNSPQDLVLSEMVELIEYDAAVHPRSGKKKRSHAEMTRDYFSLTELAAAQSMVDSEHSKRQRVIGPEELDYTGTELIYIPNPAQFLTKATNAQKIQSVRHEYDVAKAQVCHETDAATELTKKLEVLTKGYVMRHEGIIKKTEESWNACVEAEVALEGYMSLKELEDKALNKRLLQLTQKVEVVKSANHELQQRFVECTREMTALRANLGEMQRREEEERRREEEKAKEERRKEEEKAEAERRKEEEKEQEGKEKEGEKEQAEEKREEDAVGKAEGGSQTDANETAEVQTEKNDS